MDDYPDAYFVEKAEEVLAGKVKIKDLPPEVQMDVQREVNAAGGMKPKAVKKEK